MVPCKGLNSIRRYIESKLLGDLFQRIKFGYKVWSLCGNNGYPQHLDFYCGISERPRNGFVLGGKVVVEIVNVLKDMNDDDITKCEFFWTITSPAAS